MAGNLRVGIIGCGNMARHHVDGYLATKRYDVVALADLDESAMREMDARFGIETAHHRDARVMLDGERLDVVSICTWHTGHAPWTVTAAARRPKAILCEKPMAETLGRADEMLIACHRNGVKLVIGHQRRFLPAYTLARDLIARGAIGRVSLMVSFGGQGLPNYSTHQADMFRYLLGDEECRWVMGNVERKTDRFERTTRIEDSAVAVFEFERGARALILADVAPTLFQGAHIYGTDGLINLTTEELQILNAETGGVWRSHRPDGQFFTLAAEGPNFEWREGAAGQAAELADWITGAADTHRGRAENGYKALEMIHAVYESARCHERVMLPLQTRVNPLDLMVESGHLAPQRPGPYDIRAFLLRGERLWGDDPERGRPGPSEPGDPVTPVRMAQYGTRHGHADGKLAALRGSADVDFAGVLEPDPGRRAALDRPGTAYHGVRWLTHPAEILDDPTIVAVASEGRNDESLEQTAELVRAGKHVWYDKPPGDDWTRWQAVVAEARARQLRIQVGYMFRYHEGFRQIAEWARSGLLGDVFAIRAHMSTSIPLAARQVIARHPGGIFYDLAGHMLDQIVWVLGRPTEVTAFLRRDGADVPGFDDNTLGVLAYPRALGFVDIAAMEAAPMARRFEVYGSRGSAIMEPFEPAGPIRLCLAEPDGERPAGEQWVPVRAQTRQELYELELAAFVAVLQGRGTPDRSLDHELLVQETLLRATGRLPAPR